MKSILIITPSFLPEIGGVETRFNDICNELDKRGYNVTVLTYQPIITKVKGLPFEKKGNISIHRFWWIGFDLFHKLKPYPILQLLYLCPVLFLRSAIFLIGNSRNIDVIHTAGFAASLNGRFLKMFFRKRWVVSTHAIYGLKKESFSGRLIKWILAGADSILTLSDPSRQELIDIGVDKRKIVNQITWVNQDLFRPLDRETCRSKIKHKNNFIVLFVGRLLAIKGIEDLASVAEEIPFIDFVFIGDGQLKEFLSRKALAAENITFLSRVENNQLPIYYNAADVFIMPSQYKEGLGRVAVEALSSGVPIIASNLGGLAQILDESVALMIEPTKENIKSAVLYMHDHPERLVSMRKRARIFAENVFGSRNAEVIVSSYENRS